MSKNNNHIYHVTKWNAWFSSILSVFRRELPLQNFFISLKYTYKQLNKYKWFITSSNGTIIQAMTKDNIYLQLNYEDHLQFLNAKSYN